MDYNATRQQYQPSTVKMLLIAESPPPPANRQSSRQFYYTDRIRRDDRLFTNTIRALYPDANKATEKELEQNKEQWLRRFQNDGWYMIEALDESMEHAVTKQQRQAYIKAALPALLTKVHQLAGPDTGIILIKSNVFEVAAQPLRQAGFHVLNTELVDYPGHFNQQSYRKKLAALALLT